MPLYQDHATMTSVEEPDLHAADSYNYALPAELIAQDPLADRSAARLHVVNRADGSLAHRSLGDQSVLLGPGVVVVVSDTKGVPARLLCHRAKTGGTWEVLFLRVEGSGSQAVAWIVIAQTRGPSDVGERIVLT